jgi:hypothetical protein
MKTSSSLKMNGHIWWAKRKFELKNTSQWHIAHHFLFT